MSESQEGELSKDQSQFSVDLKTNKIKKRSRRRKHKKSSNNSNKIISSSYKKQKCIHFNKGNCTKGDMCTFSHSFQPQSYKKICKYFLSNACLKGQQCKYSHCTKQYPCRFYHLQNKCNQADGCRFSHQPVPSEVLSQFLKQNKEILVQMWKDNNIHLISDRDLRNAIEKYVKIQDVKNENENKNIGNDQKALPQLILPIKLPKLEKVESKQSQPSSIISQPKQNFLHNQQNQLKYQPQNIPNTYDTHSQNLIQNTVNIPQVSHHKHVKQDQQYIPQKIKFDPRQRIKPTLRNLRKSSNKQEQKESEKQKQIQKQVQKPKEKEKNQNNMQRYHQKFNQKYNQKRKSIGQNISSYSTPSWLIDITDKQQTVGNQAGLGYFTKQSLQRFLYSYY